MRLHQLPSEFQKALPILEKLKEAGYESYFVGGSVRDAILGRPIHDVDIATSAYPEETKSVFKRTIDLGIEHGTVLVLENEGEYEVTTFRTEDVYVDYRRPSSVSFVRSLEEDLKRRDFTVNAFALDKDAQVLDKFNGLSDLEQGILRAVGNAADRFQEDALRIMRGFRFAATLNFEIESETLQAMREAAPLLEKIAIERIFVECDKLLRADFWWKGLESLLATGAYDFLPALKGKKRGLEAIIEKLPKNHIFESSEQIWAMLLIACDISDVPAFCKKWKTSREFQKSVGDLVAIYQKRLQQPYTKQDAYRYGKGQLALVEGIRHLQGMKTDFARIDQLDSQLIIHDKREICVNGGLLMQKFQLKPGPYLGQLLTEIESEMIKGHLPNEEEAIFDFVKERRSHE